jgi:transposase-like protein
MSKIKLQPTYSKEFKENIVKRMLPPENISPKDLAKECTVSRTSLNNWLKEAKSIENDKSGKNKIEWVSVNIPNENKDKTIPKPIKVNIGKLTIEVETGFNKSLLLELLKVVAEI